MSIENYNDYVLDVKNTLIANISYSMLLLLIGVFVIKAFSMVLSFEAEEIKLLAFIVFLFTGVRLMTMVNMPTLEYKPRSK